MNYKLIEKPIPGNLGARKKWYASLVNKGTIKHYRLCKEIAESTKLTTADVTNVLDRYMEMIPSYLFQGYSVKLKDFATLRLSLASRGAGAADEFTAENLKQLKIIVTPDVEIKKKLKKIRTEDVRLAAVEQLGGQV